MWVAVKGCYDKSIKTLKATIINIKQKHYGQPFNFTKDFTLLHHDRYLPGSE